MAEDVFDIIKNKEFHELTSEERVEVMECCENQDEFYNMKHVLNEMDSFTKVQITPSNETKESLDSLFEEVHASRSRIWYSSIGAVIIPIKKPIYQQPLLYVAAVLVALFFIYPLGSEQIINSPDSPTIAQNTKVSKVSENQAEVTENDTRNLLSEDKSVTNIPIDSFDEPFGALSSMLEASPGYTSGSGIGTVSPDGIFAGAEEEMASVPVSRQPDVLDLLAVTY